MLAIEPLGPLAAAAELPDPVKLAPIEGRRIDLGCCVAPLHEAPGHVPMITR